MSSAERERGEGTRNAEATPKIADDAQAGQTQVPASPEEVGVPSDEELAKRAAAADDESP